MYAPDLINHHGCVRGESLSTDRGRYLVFYPGTKKCDRLISIKELAPYARRNAEVLLAVCRHCERQGATGKTDYQTACERAKIRLTGGEDPEQVLLTAGLRERWATYMLPFTSPPTSAALAAPPNGGTGRRTTNNGGAGGS